MSMVKIPSRKTQIYLFFPICLLLANCENKKKIDVSGINVDVKIERFDHDLHQLRNGNIEAKTTAMRKQYGAFYPDFIERILKAGSTQDTLYLADLRTIVNGKPYLDLQHDVDSIFPDLKDQDSELTDAFKRLKYYFPETKVPRVYAYVSGFQAQTSIGNGYIAIGLDLFLGKNSKFYPSLTAVFPRYISSRFTPDNITPRVLEGLLREDLFPETDNEKALLSKMIYNGKILYLMDEILPNVPDSTKIGYTSKQLSWCEAFEPQIWGYFIQENLLYETDFAKYQRYLTEAPFTPGLGDNNESAPKLAIWTGWQIVRQYVEKHPEISLAKLMKLNDAQMILNGSKYRPK